MVFGSGVDCSPDEAEEQESYMISLPPCTLVLTHASHKTEKTRLTRKQPRKYPSFNTALSIYTFIYVFPRSGAHSYTLGL